MNSLSISKEETALQIARRDKIQEGLIRVPKAVEPCQSFHVRRDRASKHLVLEPASRKCPRFYHYPRNPTLGFMHAGSGLAAVQRACPRQRTRMGMDAQRG